MESLLNTSVVRFPGLLTARGIHLNDATRDQAINPKRDTDVTVKVFAIVKARVKLCPKEDFNKFIQCLEHVDSLYFEKIIENLSECTHDIDNVFQCVYPFILNILNLFNGVTAQT